MDEKQKHINEIEVTRVGGFGGSDAKMFYKIGLRGLSALSNSDKIRIQVAKGMRPYKSIGATAAMQRGHDFEDWYAQQSFRPIADREVKIQRHITDKFHTFAHADFCNKEMKEVWELKFVQKPDEAIYNHIEQLQWYYLLGCSKVWAVIGDSAKEFDTACQMPVLIYPNDSIISVMEKGINILSDAWDTIDLTVGDEWLDSELLPFEQMAVAELARYIQDIKKLESLAEGRKAKILEMMQQNNIKSINSDMYIITVVPESTAATFDKKKLLKDHPEIVESDYLKFSPKKSYVKITIK